MRSAIRASPRSRAPSVRRVAVRSLPSPRAAVTTWGGRRTGAGRPPRGPRSSEPHKRRPPLGVGEPVIIVARVVRAVGDLRSPRATGAIDRVVARAHDRVDFRILEHRVIEAPSSPRARPRLPPVVARASRDDHAIRLVVEAEDRVALARGMQGFQVSAARALNAIASRRGTVFADRYQITRKR